VCSSDPETRVHNTCSAGGRSQMRRRGRFLWTDWSRARLHGRHDAGGVAVWMASVRCAWGRDLVHTRLVRHDADQLDVLDLVEGGAPDIRRLHWNLDGVTWAREGNRWRSGALVVDVAAAVGTTIREIPTAPTSSLGWTSSTYGLKVPCTVIEAESVAARAWFHTRFAMGAVGARLAGAIASDWSAGRCAAVFARLIQVR